MSKLVIIGACGQGKVAADVAVAEGYEDIVFLDDDTSIKEAAGFPVVGTCADAKEYADANFFVAIGDAKKRKELIESLPNVIKLIHPRAVIGSCVTIGKGSIVMAGTVIQCDTKIGDGCIINTSSSVDHECTLGNYVHVSVGSHLAGNVKVGDNTWVGAGSVISNKIDICGDCMIGAGSAVVKNITEPGTYEGVPAKKIS